MDLGSIANSSGFEKDLTPRPSKVLVFTAIAASTCMLLWARKVGITVQSKTQ